MDGASPSTLLDLVERLARVVEHRPHAVAVEADDATLAYAELDRLSTRLARRLCALLPAAAGEQPRVGVSLVRGATELVALLAVLKAGAAYVPLDPSHPVERLQLVLDDAAPHVLLVHPRSPLSERPGACHVVPLPDLGAIGDGPPATPLPPVPGPGALAYVMFTSGSTGRPKGVEVTRGALASFLRSMAHTPGLGPDDRLLAVTTTAFDIAGLELYLPLWVGATVVIADGETARDPRRLRRRLEGGRITVMQATPATWRLLLEAGWEGGPAGQPPLRMLCGGEGLPAALADRLLATGGALWNMYGPTETTIWSSLQRIEPGYDRITIGRAIDATTLVVLDEALRPVPAGVEGELAIGGAGLARGYFRRPELTAERFVEHAALGQRLYRTGDLVRALPDGRIEWLCRIDHQVKIRGFRVELGETEARLSAVPGVSHAVVVAIPRPDGDPSLCAYWVGPAEREALVSAARRFLPAPIVPGAWVRLERMPLNANGKVDRKQLPPPERTSVTWGPQRRARCDAETRIAAVMAEVLGLPEVPADRDFFTLGGSSVLAARVAMLLQEQMGVEVPLRLVFEAPTVEQLAARLGGDRGGDAPIVVRLRPGPPEVAPLFCLLGVHLYQDLALALAVERPVIGMHVPVRFVPGRERPPSLEAIAARYVALVRRHQATGPYHLVGLCFGGVVAYEAARQLAAAGQRVASVTIIDAVLPGAVGIDQRERLRSAVRSVLVDPASLGARLQRRGRRLATRLRRWAPAGLGRGAAAEQAIDLPIDGPDVDAEVERWSARAGRIDARLVVVRATAAAQASWQIVADDHGWGGRGSPVVVHDVRADHLGVMREPHVRSLARVLDELEP